IEKKTAPEEAWRTSGRRLRRRRHKRRQTLVIGYSSALVGWRPHDCDFTVVQVRERGGLAEASQTTQNRPTGFHGATGFFRRSRPSRTNRRRLFPPVQVRGP